MRRLGGGFERNASALSRVDGSGWSGKSDFVRAANRSRGGKVFIVLPSTAKNDSISSIVPMLSPGTHASTSKSNINYVVTEYGVAQLRGKSAARAGVDGDCASGFVGGADGAGSADEDSLRGLGWYGLMLAAWDWGKG